MYMKRLVDLLPVECDAKHQCETRSDSIPRPATKLVNQRPQGSSTPVAVATGYDTADGRQTTGDGYELESTSDQECGH